MNKIQINEKADFLNKKSRKSEYLRSARSSVVNGYKASRARLLTFKNVPSSENITFPVSENSKTSSKYPFVFFGVTPSEELTITIPL